MRTNCIADRLNLLAFSLFWVLLPLIGRIEKKILAQEQRPNIIVMLADDAGWGDYRCNGNKSVSTPNIDSIAHEGVSFEHFYVCPVCSPTRAEFLTGRYHPRGGVRGVSNGQERLNLDEVTIADYLKRAGYKTGLFGKWHNGSQWPYHPMARGFDQFYGYTSGHWGEYFDPPLEENGTMTRGQGYIVDLCTDKAIQFIEDNHRQPFFCYVPFTTPHTPWAAPKENWDKFKELPISQQLPIAAKEAIEQTRCALAMVENQDANVGRILKRIEELGLRDRTIVLYFSDNGPNSARWNDGMKGKKGSTDEGGIRSPLWIRWPSKIKSGSKVAEIAGAIDLLPTLLAIANIKSDSNILLDGRDLTPLLESTSDPISSGNNWPPRTLFSYFNGQVSARSQQYRLDSKGALFDMLKDPGQTKDISLDKADVTKTMNRSVMDWRKEVLAERSIASEGVSPNRKMNDSALKPKRINDDRPFTVGYREFPWSPLPARDGVPHGNVQRSSSAPNSSYFVNWNSKEDSITWDIEVHEKGEYEVVLDYTCPATDVGSLIELSFANSTLQATVATAWDPPLYDNQDTLPRVHGESIMKEFRPMKMGKIQLDPGRGTLTLRALEIPHKSVMDLRRVNLKLQ